MSGLYRLYGLNIGCDFPLPAARPVTEEGGIDLEINWSPASFPGQAGDAHAWNGEPVLSRQPDGGVRLVWPGEITAGISGDGRRILLQSRPDKLEYLPTVTIGIILGMALHLRGVLCLHGTALELDGHLVGFMGDSGAGKSTLAAWLLLRGARLYADDLVAIIPDAAGLPVVQPGPTGLRLCPETAEALLTDTGGMEKIPYLGKYLWNLTQPETLCRGQYAETGRPLSALYWLEPALPGQGTGASSPLPASQALGKLVEALYPPVMRRMLTSDVLRNIACLAEKLPVRVVRYERKWEHLSFFERMLSP